MRRTWNAVWRGVCLGGLLAVVMTASARAGGGETFDCPDCHPLAGLRPFAERTRLVDWDRRASWNPLANWHARPQWEMPVIWHKLGDWRPSRPGWCDGSLCESFVCWRAEKKAATDKKHPKFHGTGCGPRYWGAYLSEPLRCDPCDSCNRWRGYCGGHEMPEMLLPWQMAPCRGFRPPAEAGYGPVSVCRGCKTPTSVWW